MLFKVRNCFVHSHQLQPPMKRERLAAMEASAPEIEPFRYIGHDGYSRDIDEMHCPRVRDRMSGCTGQGDFGLYNISVTAMHSDLVDQSNTRPLKVADIVIV